MCIYQVLALDKRYLDPRRSANPTAAEKEEGIVPLTDSLPIIPQVLICLLLYLLLQLFTLLSCAYYAG